MRIFKIIAIVFVTLIVMVVATALFLQSNPGIPCPNKNAKILFSTQIADVRVACTNEERQQGLMNTKPLGANKGMLFVFPYESQHGFWMKNTPVNLSIAFISRDGVINEIREMKAQDETAVIPNKNAKYVLEMREKWFDENRILAGQQIKIKLP